jgi:hypothetical protein
MNSSITKNIIGNNIPTSSTSNIPTAFGSPIATGANPASPLYVTSGLPLSPTAHARKVSMGQSHHPPQHPSSSRPPMPGQPFASMSQAW